MKIFNKVKDVFNFPSRKFIRVASVVLILYVFFAVIQINSKTRESCRDEFVIKTEYGDIPFKLLRHAAPNNIKRVEELSAEKFYKNSCKVSRIKKDSSFVKIDCMGKNLEKISPLKAEITSKYTHKRGVISMSRGPDINSAKGNGFFIVIEEAPYFDGKYTIFGYVVGNGMLVVDKIKQINSKGLKNKENIIYDVVSSCDTLK